MGFYKAIIVTFEEVIEEEGLVAEILVAGTWRNVIEREIIIGGEWKLVDSTKIIVSGAWKDTANTLQL